MLLHSWDFTLWAQILKCSQHGQVRSTCKLCGWRELARFANSVCVNPRESNFVVIFSVKPCDITLFQDRSLFCLGPCLPGASVRWAWQNLQVDQQHVGCFLSTPLMPMYVFFSCFLSFRRGKKHSIILRTQLSVRVHACIGE